MKKIFILLMILLICFAQISYAEGILNPFGKINLIDYETDHFTFSAPADWLKGSLSNETRIYLYAKTLGSMDGGYLYIDESSQRDTATLSDDVLSTLYDACIEGTQDAPTYAGSMSTEDFRINGDLARAAQYEMKLSDKQVHVCQIFYIKDDHLFSLAYVDPDLSSNTLRQRTLLLGKTVRSKGYLPAATDAPTPEPTATPEPIKTPEPTPDIWLSAGQYKVGHDIPAGEYLVITNDSCYVEIASNSLGTLDSIISNDNISTFTYITVCDGEYLTVKRGRFCPVELAPTFAPDGDGQYKVGRDIDAGEYRLMCTSNFGYVEICSDSRHLLSSIITNDILDNGQSKYITVKDGQYLTLKGVAIQ